MQLRTLAYSFGVAALGGIALGAISFQSFQSRPGLTRNTPREAPSTERELPAETGLPALNWSVDPQSGLSENIWELETREGRIRIRFLPKAAPKSVDRIAELVKDGFYDELKFHRVIPDFVIQAGDPTDTGSGGSGKRLSPEFSSEEHLPGTVGLARGADPESADSQFYITLSAQPHLNGQYTVIGRVTEGLELARRLKEGAPILKSRLLRVPNEPKAATTANSF